MITVCSHVDGGFNDLLKSVRGKIPYEIHMVSGEWDYGIKIEFQLEMARKHPNDVLVFIDAWDCLFVGDAKELEAQYDGKLWFCGDKDSHPIREVASCYYEKDPKLLASNGRWPYLNSGCFIGRAYDIERAIDLVWRQYPPRGREISGDQRFWQSCYFAGFGEVDRDCKYFQNIWGIRPDEYGKKDGRLHNLITGTRPHFIHASGKSWNAIPDELKA